MLSAVLGLAGALVYGSADFLGGLAAKRLHAVVVTAVSALSGLALLALSYPLVGGTWGAEDLWWGALSGVTGAIAIVLLYACLAIGPMSILSPLTAVVSAIAPMLWGLLVNREQLAVTGYIGLAVALVTAVLVGFMPGAKVVRPSLRGLAMAVGAGIAIGAFLIVIDQTTDESGVVPLLMNRATNAALTIGAVAILAISAARAGRRASSVLDAAGSAPIARAWGLAIGCGMLDALANLVMLIALRLGDLSIVSVLTAMYPAGTVLLAAIVLRERIAAVQWVGLALALTAGALFALA